MTREVLLSCLLVGLFSNAVAAANTNEDGKARQEYESKKEAITRAGDFKETNKHGERDLLQADVKTNDSTSIDLNSK
ncbi:hypothetical protein OAP63_03725 [Vibrio sp.]|nr:hypothetical protein [Vibrio sp.]